MSPLAEGSEAILYHHTPWKELSGREEAFRDYAAMIHVADRMDIAFLNRHNGELNRMFTSGIAELFCPQYLKLADNCFSSRRLFERLEDGSYKMANTERVRSFRIPAKTAAEYLKMLAFAIDFRSEYTVTHTVNTVTVSLNIAEHFGLDEATRNSIYLGAFLHDVGKMAVPVEILESSGKLTDSQMDIMRTHVIETERIISGVVPDNICRISVRHHEKLDGSGYPYGLSGNELSLPERIVAAADIVSALVNKRSYKSPFPKEKVIEIISGMKGSQLDYEVCDYICSEYDDIMEKTDNERSDAIRRYNEMLYEYSQLSAVTI